MVPVFLRQAPEKYVSVASVEIERHGLARLGVKVPVSHGTVVESLVHVALINPPLVLTIDQAFFLDVLTKTQVPRKLRFSPKLRSILP